MNVTAANKFLNSCEEPLKRQLFFFWQENCSFSFIWCQAVEVPRIDDESLAETIRNKFEAK